MYTITLAGWYIHVFVELVLLLPEDEEDPVDELPEDEAVVVIEPLEDDAAADAAELPDVDDAAEDELEAAAVGPPVMSNWRE